jgi:hypothetical protein
MRRAIAQSPLLKVRADSLLDFAYLVQVTAPSESSARSAPAWLRRW